MSCGKEREKQRGFFISVSSSSFHCFNKNKLNRCPKQLSVRAREDQVGVSVDVFRCDAQALTEIEMSLFECDGPPLWRGSICVGGSGEGK